MHAFKYDNRTIKTNFLISPSGAANRSISANPEFKLFKQTIQSFTTFNYRVLKYRQAFDK